MEQKTILVIDDEPGNIDVIKNILADSYKVKASITGAKGLVAATKTPTPDVILLDIMMPEMDGYSVCRQLKSNPATRSIPVVFLSSKVTADEKRQGMGMGAVAYLTKPVDPQMLLETIDIAMLV
jgi:CheY-like chemotaxis protein